MARKVTVAATVPSPRRKEICLPLRAITANRLAIWLVTVPTNVLSAKPDNLDKCREVVTTVVRKAISPVTALNLKRTEDLREVTVVAAVDIKVMVVATKVTTVTLMAVIVEMIEIVAEVLKEEPTTPTTSDNKLTFLKI